MKLMRIIAKILVFLFVLWLIFTSFTGLLGVSVYFPLTINEDGNIPLHRLQSIRIAVFLTLAYYGTLYVFNKSKEVYPIHFVKTFLFNLCVVGLIIFYRTGVPKEEYLVAAFWIIFLLIINIATTPRIKKLFSKK